MAKSAFELIPKDIHYYILSFFKAEYLKFYAVICKSFAQHVNAILIQRLPKLVPHHASELLMRFAIRDPRLFQGRPQQVNKFLQEYLVSAHGEVVQKALAAVAIIQCSSLLGAAEEDTSLIWKKLSWLLHELKRTNELLVIVIRGLLAKLLGDKDLFNTVPNVPFHKISLLINPRREYKILTDVEFLELVAIVKNIQSTIQSTGLEIRIILLRVRLGLTQKQAQILADCILSRADMLDKGTALGPLASMLTHQQLKSLSEYYPFDHNPLVPYLEPYELCILGNFYSSLDVQQKAVDLLGPDRLAICYEGIISKGDVKLEGKLMDLLYYAKLTNDFLKRFFTRLQSSKILNPSNCYLLKRPLEILPLLRVNANFLSGFTQERYVAAKRYRGLLLVDRFVSDFTLISYLNDHCAQLMKSGMLTCEQLIELLANKYSQTIQLNNNAESNLQAQRTAGRSTVLFFNHSVLLDQIPHPHPDKKLFHNILLTMTFQHVRAMLSAWQKTLVAEGRQESEAINLRFELWDSLEIPEEQTAEQETIVFTHIASFIMTQLKNPLKLIDQHIVLKLKDLIGKDTTKLLGFLKKHPSDGIILQYAAILQPMVKEFIWTAFSKNLASSLATKHSKIFIKLMLSAENIPLREHFGALNLNRGQFITARPEEFSRYEPEDLVRVGCSMAIDREQLLKVSLSLAYLHKIGTIKCDLTALLEIVRWNLDFYFGSQGEPSKSVVANSDKKILINAEEREVILAPLKTYTNGIKAFFAHTHNREAITLIQQVSQIFIADEIKAVLQKELDRIGHGEHADKSGYYRALRAAYENVEQITKSESLTRFIGPSP